MRVIEIVNDHLIENGFGGLVADGAECGCEIDNLVPCGSDFSQCQSGYNHQDPRPGNEGGWAIWLQKEPPTPEQWKSVEY